MTDEPLMIIPTGMLRAFDLVPDVEWLIPLAKNLDRMEIAGKAISHLIKHIGEDPRLAYLISPMSESYDLLTSAYAEMKNVDVDAFRAKYEDNLKFEQWPREAC